MPKLLLGTEWRLRMARQTKPLNNTEVKNAKAPERTLVLYDGDGLELQVTTGGSKLWRFRYYKPFTRKRAMISLGSYPLFRSLRPVRIVKQPALFSVKISIPKSISRQSSFIRKVLVKVLLKKLQQSGLRPKKQPD